MNNSLSFHLSKANGIVDCKQYNNSNWRITFIDENTKIKNILDRSMTTQQTVSFIRYLIMLYQTVFKSAPDCKTLLKNKIAEIKQDKSKVEIA